MHPLEQQIRQDQPTLGDGYESRCLPSWINSMCKRWERGEGVQYDRNTMGNLLHTLVAARVRNEKMAAELAAIRAEVERLQAELVELRALADKRTRDEQNSWCEREGECWLMDGPCAGHDRHRKGPLLRDIEDDDARLSEQEDDE